MKKVKVSKGLLMTALITGVCTWGGIMFPAFAEELGEYTLDQMVVTATRTEKRDVDVPASTEILTHDQIVASGATNVMEALGKVNGIELKSFFPGGSAMTSMIPEINIRGFGNGTLVMVNGNPINLNQKYVLDAIPTESIDKIEVIKGGGSVMYGSEGVGGVVNIITKKTGNNSISAGIGNYHQRKYNVALGNEKFKVNYDVKNWGSVRHLSDSANPPVADTYQYNQNRSKKENFGLGYNFTDELSLEYNHYNSEVDYCKNLVLSDEFKEWRETSTKQDLYQLNYVTDDLKAHMWYTENEIAYVGGSKPGVISATTRTETKNRTYGIDVQKDFNLTEKTLLTMGANYKDEKYSPRISKGGRVSNDMSRNNFAVFAQVDHKMGDKDNLIISGRETWTTGAFNSQNYNNFSAAGQWLHKLGEDQNMYVSVGQSFIMPTFSQMYPSGLLAGVPNPDLEPMEGINYELGYKQIAGNHVWKAALFHMEVDNNITATWKNDKYTYKNEDFKNTGLEGSLSVKASDKYSYNLGFTIQDPKSKVTGSAAKTSKQGWQRKFGKYQIKSGIDYSLNKFKASFTGSYIWDRYSSPSASNSYKIKPYFLTTMTATYSPDKSNDISLIVDNVFDRQDHLSNTMSNYGTYYSTPTNFLLTYTYKF